MENEKSDIYAVALSVLNTVRLQDLCGEPWIVFGLCCTEAYDFYTRRDMLFGGDIISVSPSTNERTSRNSTHAQHIPSFFIAGSPDT